MATKPLWGNDLGLQPQLVSFVTAAKHTIQNGGKIILSSRFHTKKKNKEIINENKERKMSTHSEEMSKSGGFKEDRVKISFWFLLGLYSVLKMCETH